MAGRARGRPGWELCVICAACGVSNREGARFCVGCGEPLATRCGACDTELPADARFCDACGAAVAEAAEPAVAGAAEPTGAPPAAPKPGEARKVVTIVFADLAGSTSLQERMDAESARRVMDRFYTAMRGAVTAHSGTVVKFMGDGMMAAFGVPTVAEDDAARAVRAAVAMQEAFVAVAGEVRAEWETHVGLRVGVNTGEVVVAEGEDDVVGDAVNVAARLEHAAGESNVLVGHETWRLTRDLFTYEDAAALELKGKAGRVPAYRLVSLSPPASEEVSPFVGRDPELARLAACFERAVEDGRAQLVTVVGSPGLGKSRLVRELARRLGPRARLLEGQCEAGGASTFAPVAEILRQAAGIDEAASADAALDALAALFPDDADASRIATAAASALGVGDTASPEETFWGIRRVVEQVAAAQPVVVVVDDVHWAEPLLLDLLEHLAEWTRDAPVLLVALARPEIRDVRLSLADASGTPSDVLVLDALPDDEGLRLASELLEGHPLDEGMAARLLTSAGGNPLFLRELVKMLLDDGVLHLHDGVWMAAEGAEVDVPPTINALLSARIERLGPDERSVVERASVVGHQFFRGAVAVLSPPPVASRIDSHLETLRRKEVVEPEGTYWIDEPVFRFHHALIRDAAYRRLLKEVRADLHERVADWLALKAGELVGEHEEVIGYHLEQAYEARRELGSAGVTTADVGVRASRHLAAAARRSLDRDDLRAAAGLIGRAVACLPADDPARAELLVDRCEALLGLGEIAVGAEALAELEQGSSQSPRLAAWAEAFAAEVASFAEPETLPEWVDRAAAAADRFDELGDPVGTAKAASVHASILARLGQVAACETALDRALAAAREAGDRRRANGVLAGAPLAALWGPSPVTRAAGRCLDVVRVLRITTDSPPVEAVALRAQGVLEAFRGRFDAARRLVASSRRTLEELGLRHGILQTELFAGLVELAADDPAAAEACLRGAYEGFRAFGVGVDTAQAAALLARACLAQGRDGEALELTEESERLGGHDFKTAIAWRAVRAEALAGRGETEEAVRLAREAVELAAPTDALVDHADAHLALSAVLAAGGDASGAEQEARRAAELYEAKGATVLAGRALGLAGSDAPTPAGGAEAEPAPAHQEPARALSNLATAAFNAYARLVDAKDTEGIVALVSPDYTLEERGRAAQTTIAGHEGVRQALGVMFQADCRMDHEVLATRGQRLSLVRAVNRVRDPWGGTSEHPFLRLDETDERGALVHSIAFDPDGLDEAFDELDEWFMAQVEPACRPILEVSKANRRAYNERDWTEMRSLLADDAVFVDHRPSGWGTLDADAYIERFQALIPLAQEVNTYSLDCAALRPGGVLSLMRSSGIDAAGGRFEVTFDYLALFADGKFERVEFFDPADHARARARFEEVTASAVPDLHAGNLALQAWDRGRRATAAGDLDGVLGVMADDVTYEERTRSSGLFEPLRGKEALAELYAPVFSGRVSFPELAVVATRGARLALTRAKMAWTDRAGQVTEHPHLRLDETDESGRIVATIHFDVDAVLDAVEEMNRRYVEADTDERAALQISEATSRAHADADWDEFARHLTPGFVGVDHRRGRWAELDADGYLDLMRSLKDMAPDAVIWPVRFETVRGEASIATWMARGTTLEGGLFELTWVSIGVCPGGMLGRYEAFEVDDRAALLDRFEELTRGDGSGRLANRVTAVWDRYAILFQERDVDGILALAADDYTWEDRQRHARVPTIDRAGFRRLLETIFELDVRRFVTEVVAVRGDRLALGRMTLHLGSPTGGDTEVSILSVAEVDDAGRLHAGASFSGDDLDGAYDELDQRFLAHVDPACRPVLEACNARRRALNRSDWAALRALLTDEFHHVSHAPLAAAVLGERDTEALVGDLDALIAQAPDHLWHDVETLRLAPDCALHRHVSSGTEPREGGRYEVAAFVVEVVRGGRIERTEVFDESKRAEAEARFEQLTTTRVAGATNLVTAVWDRYRDLFPRHDVEGILATVVPDYVLEERQAHARHTSLGQEGFRELLTAIFQGEFTRVDSEVLAVRGPHVALVRVVWHVRARTGGELEIAHLRVDEAGDDGRLVRSVVFDGEALDAAFEEQEARFLTRVDPACGPVLEANAAGCRAYNARDWVEFRKLQADDFVLVDHRPGWYGTMTRDEYVDRLSALVELAPDARLDMTEIARVAPDCLAGSFSVHGTDRGGGPFEIAGTVVLVSTGGRSRRQELFEASDRARAIARFEELVATSREPGLVNDAVCQMWRANERIAAKDLDGTFRFYAEGVTTEERRHSSHEVSDARALEEWLRWAFERAEGFTAVDFEPLATRGDRLALGTQTYRFTDVDGSDGELCWLQVVELDGDGLVSRFALFEPDDVDNALDELDRAFRDSLEETERASFDHVVTGRRAYNTHDWDAVSALLSDDFRLVDHRPGWFGTLDRDGYLARLAGLPEVAPDASITVFEVPRIAPGASVAGWRTTATGPEGGRVEIAFYLVGTSSDGKAVRFEFFPLERRDEALERFDEVSQLAGSSPGMRLWDEWLTDIRAGTVDGIARRMDDGYRLVDHRLGATLGMEEQVTSQRKLAGTAALSLRVDPVLDLDRVTVARLRYRWPGARSGPWADVGEGETVDHMVSVLDETGARVVLQHRFAEDQLHRAIALAEERHAETASDPEDAETSGRFARVWGLVDAYNAADWPTFRRHLSDDFTAVDHRTAGWGPVEGPDGVVELLRGRADLSVDPRWVVHGLPHRGRRVVVVDSSLLGTDQQQGPYELAHLWVLTVDDSGRAERGELFPPDRLADARTAADAAERLTRAGPAVQMWARFVAAVEAGDLTGLASFLAPGYHDHDHINDVVIDAEAQLENQRFVASAEGLSVEWSPALDLGREAVLRARYRWSAGGAVWDDAGWAEHSSLMVGMVDELGRASESHRFAEDQLHAALAVVEERHARTVSDAEEAADSRAFARFWNLVEAYNRDDWPALAGMWADDVVTVDHRPAGWGTVEGRDAYMDLLRGLADVSGDRRWIVQELLHRGHRSLAVRWSVVGTDRDGGPFEMAFNVAVGFDGAGLVNRQELHPLDRAPDAVAAAVGFEGEREG